MLTIVGHDIPTGSDNHSLSLGSYSGWWFGTVYISWPFYMEVLMGISWEHIGHNISGWWFGTCYIFHIFPYIGEQSSHLTNIFSER